MKKPARKGQKDAPADEIEATPVDPTQEVTDFVDAHDRPQEPVTLVEPELTESPPEEPEALAIDERAAHAPVEAAQTKRSSGLVPLLLGGVMAGAIGFGVARFAVPEGWPFPRPENGALQEDLTPRLVALEVQVEKLASEQVVDEPGSGIDSDDLLARLAELTGRLEALEARPQPAADLSGFAEELADLRAAIAERPAQTLLTEEIQAAAEAAAQARMAEMEAEAAALRAEADASARNAAVKTALVAIRSSVDAGQPFAEALATLSELGLDPPKVLVDQADNGVPSLTALQETFPDVARDALASSVRATMGDGVTDRLATFLQLQTGMRSLEPREGDAPDAVLSRMEGSLRSGELEKAMAEMAALPAEGQQVLGPWADQVRTRLDVENSLTALAAALSQ
jgi:hypothetical protein